ncbi:uncharacterized protein [Amphiura filiformis]|uniref:uncharacterized protein n=1 Tax=Amphiura filiformis TaxID=82378 RepID=UPI003B222956
MDLAHNLTCEYVEKLINHSRSDIQICNNCYVTNLTYNISGMEHINSRYRIDVSVTNSTEKVTAVQLRDILVESSGFVTLEGFVLEVSETTFSVEEPFQCSSHHPCKNKGRCELNMTDHLPYCRCVYGFSGAQCKTLPPEVVKRPDVSGTIAGILVYLIAITCLFSIIAALTDDDEDEYLHKAGYTEDIRMI